MVENIVMKEFSGRHSDPVSAQLLILREVIREWGDVNRSPRAHYLSMAAGGEGLLTIFYGQTPIGFVHQGLYADGDRQLLIRGSANTFKGVKDDVTALDTSLLQGDVYIKRGYDIPEVREQVMPAFERYRAEVLKQ